MPPRDVARLRVAGRFASRRILYRAIAHALAGVASPAGAVFETPLTGPPPGIWVRPARLLGGPGPLQLVGVQGSAEAPTSGLPEPAEDLLDRCGVLLPSAGEAADRTPGGSAPAAHPPLGWCGKVSGWAAVQVLWSHPGPGPIRVAVRFRVAARTSDGRDRLFATVAARLIADWHRSTGLSASVAHALPGSRRDWRRAGVRALPRRAWRPLLSGSLEATPEVGFRDLEPPRPADGHTVVFGASGTGKTTYLAHRAVHAISGGGAAVVVDLHGDLAPAILDGLPRSERTRTLAIDAGRRPVVGVAGLVSDGPSIDRAAGQFVAAVKRLSPDGADLAWGFRLERIFDTFARLVLESGGTLLDLYAFLTDPRRREAALLEPHGPATARFLEELGPIVRRNPEFLWSAATRLSKVVLLPELSELLAPSDGGVDVERWVRRGRSILVRLPIASLGPEAAAFAATLVLGRIYLGLTGSATGSERAAPILLVLDEVQSFPPRLVSEILAESRKFGVEALVATQYPDRLPQELRAAAAGAASTFIAFRIPPASASQVGPWVGLSPASGGEILPTLPVGVALALDPDGGTPRWLGEAGPPLARGERAWTEALEATRAEFGGDPAPVSPGAEEGAVERVLLAILSAEENGRPLPPAGVAPAASRLAGPPIDPAELEGAWTRLARGPEIETTAAGIRLTPSGERRLGLGAATGAVSESAEHRALLLRAFRVFARKGYAIEILRQGRFDTTLPDAVFRQLGSSPRTSPAEVARTLDRVRSGWAWRCFAGRDVHLEAEVSGALRPERIRRGCAKATARDAFALFLVGDAGRARRVRSALRSLGLGTDRAQVWTLGPAVGPRSRG